MRIVQVDDIPANTNRSRKDKKDLKSLLAIFLNRNLKYAEVIFTEDDYKTPMNARQSIYQCVREQGYPVCVYIRNDRVFLERMPD
jgi:L-amino acid N-acyltransferase YncA